MGEKARVALAGSAGVDLYQVTATGGWTYERQLTSRAYQSLLLHQGFLYGAGFDRIDRIDPESGATTTLVTRNAGPALAAGWTTADTQQLMAGPDGLLYFSTAFGSASGQGVFRLAANGTSFARFIDRSGGIGAAAWDLNNARGLAWLSGKLYVSSRGATNSTSRPVYEFNAAGQFVRILRGDLRAPQGLLADGDSLRVAGYGGYLNRLSPGDGGLAGLVSGLPSMIVMSAVELFGEVHVVTYQHGIWRHRESSALTRAFTPLTSQHTSMVVVPQVDPYDAWIGGYVGLSGIEKQDDPDGDGVPNGLEFLLGWSPADGLSRFSATLVRSGENTFRLRWPSGPGAVFTVRSSSDLRDWSRIEAFVTGSAGESSSLWDIPVAAGNHRFYRIEWLPPVP
jgi:hypothetical protein